MFAINDFLKTYDIIGDNWTVVYYQQLVNGERHPVIINLTLIEFIEKFGYFDWDDFFDSLAWDDIVFKDPVHG